MTLPAASATRRLKHRRQIDVQVYDRGNGLWEVDATLVDEKTRDALLGGKVRPAGEPIHEMLLRIVVDERFEIIEAGAQTRWMPYEGQCDAYGDVYSRLVGLNLMQGFREALRERVGGVLGCTHITELCSVLPTAVLQGFAGVVLDTHEGKGSDQQPQQQPYQIDRCHALRSDGEVVKTCYPRWYRGAASSAAAAEPAIT